MSTFDDMLSIKRHRESEAQRHFLACQREHQEAEQRHADAQQELFRFQETARQRELDMYAELCKRAVRRQDIEHVYACIATLREQEHQHRARLAQLDEERERAREVKIEAQEQYREAGRNTEKFIELVRLHSLEEALENERREDNDMEEVAALAWGRVEDIGTEQEGVTQ